MPVKANSGATGRSRRPRYAAILVAAAILPALPAGTVSAAATAPALLAPTHGRAFAPVLGDWEGVAGGYPISVAVGASSGATPRVTYDRIIVLRPSTCPVSATSYSEELISGAQPIFVAADGTLRTFGLHGRFTGPRTLLLSRRYRVGACRGQVHWTLHPVRRALVLDGAWRVRFAGGQTVRARVVDGGRLMTGVTLPHALTVCNGLRGAVDLFITPSGRALLDGTNVRVAMRFGPRRATGTVDAPGRGCPGGPFRFTARLG